MTKSKEQLTEIALKAWRTRKKNDKKRKLRAVLLKALETINLRIKDFLIKK